MPSREWFSYMQYGDLFTFRCWCYLTFFTTGIQIYSSEFGLLFLYFSLRVCFGFIVY
jgi:hypothetical protein